MDITASTHDATTDGGTTKPECRCYADYGYCSADEWRHHHTCYYSQFDYIEIPQAETPQDRQLDALDATETPRLDTEIWPDYAEVK